MASKGDIKTKNSAMAARLKEDSYHRGEAVERRKASRLNALLASLSPKLSGTARYRRMNGNR